MKVKTASEIKVGDVIDGRARVDRVEHPSVSGCTNYGNGGIHIYSEGRPAFSGCYQRDYEMTVEDSDALVTVA